jgi:hypothetical protein
METDEIKTEEAEIEVPTTPQEDEQSPLTLEKKKVHTPALVLMIVGAVFSIVFPIIAYVCCIISLVFAIKNRKVNKTTATIVIDIIALVVALTNSIFGAMIFSGALKLR